MKTNDTETQQSKVVGYTHIEDVLTGRHRKGDFVILSKKHRNPTKGNWTFHGARVNDKHGNLYHFSKRMESERLLIATVAVDIAGNQEKGFKSPLVHPHNVLLTNRVKKCN